VSGPVALLTRRDGRLVGAQPICLCAGCDRPCEEYGCPYSSDLEGLGIDENDAAALMMEEDE